VLGAYAGEFLKAERAEPEAVGTTLAHIWRLYVVEGEIRERGLAGANKLSHRARHARPAVQAFFASCHERVGQADVVPSHPLSKALKYALEREAA